MRKTRKLVSILLAFVMVLGFIPVGLLQMPTAKAQELPKTTLRPKGEIAYTSTVADWEPTGGLKDAINKSSVPLKERSRGSLVNPLASDEAKIQVLSLMNAKGDNTSSVGGDIFHSYAFDFWQYTDSMIFWDGVIPTPDVIDAGHRNGVPVYGTLFFNWSTSYQDNIVFRDFIKEDSLDSNTFPAARKLVDMAKYYGFDGYFVNQETTGTETNGKGMKMRNCMLYAKKYAEEQGYPIMFSWYDAMANNGGRYHYNAVNANNDYYVKPDETNPQRVPADDFFMNFNWSTNLVKSTNEHMTSIGRSPFDAYAGFELQQNSINTRIRFEIKW